MCKNNKETKCPCCASLETLSTGVLREADGQRALGDLLLEQVLLVEEQDDGRLCEPLVIADGVEQLHALVHAVLGLDGHKCGDKSSIGKINYTQRTQKKKITCQRTPALFPCINTPALR